MNKEHDDFYDKNIVILCVKLINDLLFSYRIRYEFLFIYNRGLFIFKINAHGMSFSKSKLKK